MSYDIKEIKKDFIKVIEYSQNIMEPAVDKLFDTWLDNKRDIIEAMDGKLIYEFPEKISFELSDEGKEERVQSFINLCWDLGFYDLSSFVDYEREGFYKNTCEKDYQNKVSKGTKLVKAFKYFIEDKEALNDMQSKASQIIQENKVEGTLCFSVHPLDYLSISENAHNWRSCHALDGEYRAGNISYMGDNSTIVCYLKADGEYKLPHFPEDVLWNSKKWRVLLYLSNDWKMIFAGKQYPFSTIDGMNTIIDKCFNPMIKTRCSDSPRGNWCWSHWTDYKIKELEVDNAVFEMADELFPVGTQLIKLNTLVKNVEGSKQFNDVLNSSCYTPMYTFLSEPGWWNGGKRYPLTRGDRTRFEIGSMTYCLRCGVDETMEGGEATMMCFECERNYGTAENDAFTFCSHCGRRIETENGYWMNEQMYCENCFDDLGTKCENCGDYYLTEDTHYIEKEDLYLCDWCYRNR